MRDDDDFDAFVAARWQHLVATGVRLGARPAVAEEAALATLARLRPTWRRLRQTEDVDAAVHRELVAAHGRRDSPPNGRTPPVVAEATVSVPPTPETIHALVRRARTRRWRLAAQVSLALVLVAALTGWLLTTSAADEPGLARARTTAATNPAPLAWYADGALHLDQVVIQLPPLRGLVVLAGGAVYVDRRGAVVQVDDRGRRTRVGTTIPESRIARAADRSFVVWTDPGKGPTPRPALVVLDVDSGTVTARRPFAPATDPSMDGVIAVDDDRVVYRDADGTFAWHPGDDRPVLLEEDGLLDAARGTVVLRAPDDTLRVRPDGSAVTRPVAGDSAELSDDGRRVLTREADRLSIYGSVRIYDTRTGASLPTGIGPEDRVITAQLGPGDTVTYLVARAQDQPRPGSFIRLSFVGPWQLRTCAITTGRCTVRTKVASSGSPPMLVS